MSIERDFPSQNTSYVVTVAGLLVRLCGVGAAKLDGTCNNEPISSWLAE